MAKKTPADVCVQEEYSYQFQEMCDFLLDNTSDLTTSQSLYKAYITWREEFTIIMAWQIVIS